jgi:hypothetical protein
LETAILKEKNRTERRRIFMNAEQVKHYLGLNHEENIEKRARI